MNNKKNIDVIFSELKYIKQKHSACEKKQKLIYISYAVMFVFLFILGKKDINLAYLMAMIDLVYIIFMDTLRKKLGEEEKHLVIKYKNIYEDHLIPIVLSNHYDEVKFDKQAEIDGNLFKNLIHIASGETYLVKDYFEGKYKGVFFRQATIKAELSYVGVYGEVADFHGRLFVFETPKIVEEVYIYSKKFSNKPHRIKKLSVIETEDVYFNSCFDVSAAKAEEAFYVLTPHIMEVLIDLTEKYGSIGMLTRQGYIYIIFNQLNYTSRDIDINIFTPLDYFTEASKIKNFYRITDVLIEEFSLDLNVNEE